MALLARYQMNGNGNDALGANNLTATNVTRVPGIANQGGSFDWSTSTCRINNSLWIDWGSMSMSGFIKMNNEIWSWIQAFATQGNTGTQTTYSMLYEYNGWTRRLRYTRVMNSIITWDVYYNISLGNSNRYYVSMTYDWSLLKAYLNWVFLSQTATSGNWSAGWTTWFDIWAWNGGTVFFADAVIDEVEVHNTAITNTDIKNKYLYYKGFI